MIIVIRDTVVENFSFFEEEFMYVLGINFLQKGISDIFLMIKLVF